MKLQNYSDIFNVFGERDFKFLLKNIFENKSDYLFNNFIFSSKEEIDRFRCITTNIINSSLSDFRVLSLLKKLETLREDVFDHSINTSLLSTVLALKSEKFSLTSLEAILLGGLFHDIGKIKLFKNADITTSKDLLDKRDFQVVSEHPKIGFELLNGIEVIPDAAKKIVLMHHVWTSPKESYNMELGTFSSYPEEYNGRKLIPENKGLSVSIVQISDDYDSYLRGSRGKRLNKQDAINNIIAAEKTIYGEGVDLFREHLSPFSIGDIVELNTCDRAIVVRHTNMGIKPIVKYISGTLGSKLVDLRSYPALSIRNVIGGNFNEEEYLVRSNRF